MYSVVLMLSLQVGQPPAVETSFDHVRAVSVQTSSAGAGCSGTARTPIRTTLRASAAVVQARPRPIPWLWTHFPHPFHRKAGAGCGGAAVTATGCSGGFSYSRDVAISRSVTVGTAPMPATSADFAFGNDRRRVERQLRIAFRTGNITEEQKAAAETAMADPDARAAVVASAHKIVNRQMGAGGQVGKIGDGTLLKLILDNLPQIIAAVMAILKAFGIGWLYRRQLIETLFA